MHAWIPAVSSGVAQQSERLMALARSDGTTMVAFVVLLVCAALALIAGVVSAAMAVHRKRSHRDAEYHRHSWV
jgi:hypothetical protein